MRPLRLGRDRPQPGTASRALVRGIAFGAVVCALAMSAPAALQAQQLSHRHLESNLNTQFRYTGMPFYDYVNHVRTIIDKTRVDLTAERRLQIIDANSPFEWRPGRDCPRGTQARFRDGVLLIHGLSDSPYQMRDVAKFFQSRCFLVRAILLPGHGTVPGDLLSVTYESWIKATRYGLDTFLNPREVERLYIAGFSTGGALALLEAADNVLVQGVLLFSPAVKIKSNLGFMANWHKSISWAAPSKQWLDIADDHDYAKYESFTFNAADQIYLLTKHLDQRTHELGVKFPMFMALSEDDATVDAEDAIKFFKDHHNPNSRMVLYTNRKADDGDSRIERRPSAYPEQNILNFAHLSIHLAPDNPHYGAQGDYQNCLHYLSDAPKLKLCREGSPILRLGEVTEGNLKKYVVRRLTYNPDFGHLMKDAGDFLDRTR